MLLLLLLLSAPAGATDVLQAQMPLLFSSDGNTCVTCHLAEATPTESDPALNDFGLDFSTILAWNSTLANLDSDGDGCTNGAEIGDVDGNGQPDEGVTEASSNPGLGGDCSSASVLDQKSWGDLKAMFNR